VWTSYAGVASWKQEEKVSEGLEIGAGCDGGVEDEIGKIDSLREGMRNW
jgi:hypothetical protein